MAGSPKPAIPYSSARPGPAKHLATALGIAAGPMPGTVAFAPATGWITRLAEAHRTNRLDAELRRSPLPDSS